MAKKRASPEPKTGKRAWLENRTHDELEEPPITPEQARRELGFDLLPFNGGDREGQD